MTKSLIANHRSDEFENLYNKFFHVIKRCEFDENDEDIYQQMVSMLTEEEIKAIEHIFEMIIEIHPNYDIHKLNYYFIVFLDDKFSFPSNSSDGRKRSKNKQISKEDSLKILRGLDFVKRHKIYDDGLPPPPPKMSGSLIRFRLNDQHQKLLKMYTDKVNNEEYKKKKIDKTAIDDSQNYRYEMILDLDYGEAYHLYDELTLLSEVIDEMKKNIQKIHYYD
jgi:hypothetical protein